MRVNLLLSPAMIVGTHSSPDGQYGNLQWPGMRLCLDRIERVFAAFNDQALSSSIPDLVSVACLTRCIQQVRGKSPELWLVAQSALARELNQLGVHLLDLIEVTPQQSSASPVSPLASQGPLSGHTLFLPAGPMYERHYAVLLGRLALMGIPVESYPHIIADNVPLDLVKNKDGSLSNLLLPTLASIGDVHVRRLCATFVERQDEASKLPEYAPVQHALEVLQIQRESGLPISSRGTKAPDISTSVRTMIAEWASGELVPSSCRSLAEVYDDAHSISSTIWGMAKELAPGIYELQGCPPEEQDVLIRILLRRLFNSDARAVCVLEKFKDRPANALRQSELRDFKSRLGRGEDAGVILAEIRGLFESRRDTSSVAAIGAAEHHRVQPSHIVRAILKEAEYQPDPAGICTVLKLPPTLGALDLMQRLGIPVVPHRTIVARNAAGQVVPIIVTIKASHVPRLIQAIAAAG